MDIDKAKIFVGGISRDTSEDALRVHFSKYGTVLGSLVAKDKVTKNSRGFGFVRFSDSTFADKALQDSHVILGRTVEVKKAIPKLQFPNQHPVSRLNKSSTNGNGNLNDCFRTKKIFVGGLSSSLTEAQFKNYFESFGKIVDVVVMQDSSTNRPRGFGFVTFDSEESVDKAVEKNFHELNGKLVEVKRAVPKEEINGSASNGYIRKFGERGSSTNSFESGNYFPYCPGYEIFPSYVPLFGYNAGGLGGYSYGTNIYNTYPALGYDGLGFRSPWIGATMFPSPYNGSILYPAHINGGVRVADMMVYPEGNGKPGEAFGGNGYQPSDATVCSTEDVTPGINSSDSKDRETGACS